MIYPSRCMVILSTDGSSRVFSVFCGKTDIAGFFSGTPATQIPGNRALWRDYQPPQSLMNKGVWHWDGGLHHYINSAWGGCVFASVQQGQMMFHHKGNTKNIILRCWKFIKTVTDLWFDPWCLVRSWGYLKSLHQHILDAMLLKARALDFPIDRAIPGDGTKWDPTSCRRSFNPYKWPCYIMDNFGYNYLYTCSFDPSYIW